MNEPYSVLGVRPSATDEEITRAYKSLARKYHPDLNPGDASAELRMKEINAAYEQIKAVRSGKGDPYASQQSRTRDEASGYGGSPFGDFGDFGGFGGFGGFYGNRTSGRQENGEENNENQPFRGTRRVIRIPFFRIILIVIVFRLAIALISMFFSGLSPNSYSYRDYSPYGYSQEQTQQDNGSD